MPADNKRFCEIGG